VSGQVEWEDPVPVCIGWSISAGNRTIKSRSSCSTLRTQWRSRPRN